MFVPHQSCLISRKCTINFCSSNGVYLIIEALTLACVKNISDETIFSHSMVDQSKEPTKCVRVWEVSIPPRSDILILCSHSFPFS